MSRGMAERQRRKGIQSFLGRYAAPNTVAAHERGLLADSDKTLARPEARDTTVIDVYQET